VGVVPYAEVTSIADGIVTVRFENVGNASGLVVELVEYCWPRHDSSLRFRYYYGFGDDDKPETRSAAQAAKHLYLEEYNTEESRSGAVSPALKVAEELYMAA